MTGAIYLTIWGVPLLEGFSTFSATVRAGGRAGATTQAVAEDVEQLLATLAAPGMRLQPCA
jgi:hypothetical protein